MNKIIAQAELVKRDLPVNLVEKDYWLFVTEIEKHLFETKINYFRNVIFSSEGVVFNNLFPVFSSLSHNSSNPNLINYAAFFKRRACIKINSIHVRQVIWIADPWSSNYFHWFLDSLPKLLLAQEHTESGTIVLPSHLAQLEFISHSLDKLESDYLFLESNCNYRADSFSYTSKVAPSGNYRPEVVLKLSEKLRVKKKSSEKIIFIHREATHCRSLINENEVYKMLIDNGVEIVDFGNLSWPAQVQLLGECKLLIGAHGAGLANMLFLPRTSSILELRQNNNHKDNCYFSLASALNLKYFYFNCNYELFKGSDRFGRFKIDDLEKFKSLLIQAKR